MMNSASLISRRWAFAALALWCLASAGAANAQRLVANPDHPDGIYHAGDTVKWRVQWEGGGTPPATFDYVLKKGGLTEVGKGTATLTDNAATVEAKFDAPGTLLLEIRTP